MTSSHEPRKAARSRWRSAIVDHLEDFPRQYAALESAMSAFGEDFDLGPFKQAFEADDDPQRYNQVQAVERAVGRVQNYVAELADASASLAGLERPSPRPDGSRAQQAFEALRDAGIIDGRLCRQLVRAQSARTRIEHSYVDARAGDVHAAARLVHESSRDFLAAFRPWIEAHLG